MKVLIPVDGSVNSNAALDFITSRAACLGARPELRLLNVQFPIPPRAARAAGRELVRSFHQTEARAVLDPAQKCLADAGLTAKTQYVVGNPAEVVSRTATQGHADLVVMGSRGQTALKGLLFGSVTQAVLASSTAPLLVLRDGPPPRAASLRVVIAVDGSRYGLAAVRAALALRAVFGPAPQFRLLHVVDGQEDAADLEAATAPALALFVKAKVEAELVRLDGHNAGDAIAEYLAAHPADLLVMGSHGRGAFKAVLLGSVATRVAARCRLPLLIARPRSRRSPAKRKDGAAAAAPRGLPSDDVSPQWAR
ncbi:MAG: universal stress protein [Burkholderiaceae bacterium]|nr:universal stress protein [Burkholderiaceae bacterium]